MEKQAITDCYHFEKKPKKTKNKKQKLIGLNFLLSMSQMDLKPILN